MAFDGLAISGLVHEFNQDLTGGRITKIYQPENDELILIIKNNGGTFRLLLSASASLPLAYMTQSQKNNPATAPNFCMLLRKHIGGGKILSITQPSMERIIIFEIEHLNDMGDICTKKLIVELMGKHSNIIFSQPDDTIIDSIKHISANVSSIREVLPGRAYFIPQTQHKENPLTITKERFFETVMAQPVAVSKAIYTSLTGISPAAAEEIVFDAMADSSTSPMGLSDTEKNAIYESFVKLMNKIKNKEYTPNIIYKNQVPIDFSVIKQSRYLALNKQDAEPVYKEVTYTQLSQLLESFYAEKNTVTRIRQKSVDLRKIVSTALERNQKKYDLQMRQLKDTEKRDKYRIYGELINTYGYDLESEATKLNCLDYYSNEEISIPLDPQLSIQENSVRYFDRYNKLKRTYEALCQLTIETKNEIDHLESISTALDIALQEEDLVEIKEELVQFGYIKKKSGKKSMSRKSLKSKPFHYISSDGFHMYVGKNNIQNEELTFKFATGNDWWFHAKGIPGSHVIVKSENKELPDATFEEAGRLAAYYSKGQSAPKVEVDYIEKKHVKKTAGNVPGFVIYHTNYSLLIEPDISAIKKVED